MTDQELEQRLRTALEHAAPDHLEASPGANCGGET